MRKIYLQSRNTISSLKEEPFAKELILQNLLEHHPELIPSDEIIGNPSFLMVQPELPVSTGFIDLFLIDQMMVPTIIETKVNNPEIRRKIIGQGYEYLTSLSLEFSGKQIVDYAKSYWKKQYTEKIKSSLNIDALNEKEIERNLKKPRLRLIFAADFIPRELKQFVEFINNASRGIDVYALQVEQFLLDDKKILSITTYGPTEKMIHEKSTAFGLLSRDEFINKINKNDVLSKEEKVRAIQRINQILDLAESHNFEIKWGTKSVGIVLKDTAGEKLGGFGFYYSGQVYVEYVPFAQRDSFWNSIYDALNEALDLQKSYLKETSAFKAGKRSFYTLSEDQFSTILSSIKKMSEKA